MDCYVSCVCFLTLVIVAVSREDNVPASSELSRLGAASSWAKERGISVLILSFYQWNINWFNSKTKGKFNSKAKKVASSVSFEGQGFTCGPVRRKGHTVTAKGKEEAFGHRLQSFSGRRSVSQLTRWICPYPLFPDISVCWHSCLLTTVGLKTRYCCFPCGNSKEILPKWAPGGRERWTLTCKHACGQMDRGLENKMQWTEVLGRSMSIRKGQADTPGGPFCREAPVSEDTWH